MKGREWVGGVSGGTFTIFKSRIPDGAHSTQKFHVFARLKIAFCKMGQDGTLRTHVFYLVPIGNEGNTHRDARTHDHKVKSFALCRLS